MAEKKIDVEQVRHVARLARMELSPAEEQSLLADLSAILTYVESSTSWIPARSNPLRRWARRELRCARMKSPTGRRRRRCWRTRPRIRVICSKCPR